MKNYWAAIPKWGFNHGMAIMLHYGNRGRGRGGAETDHSVLQGKDNCDHVEMTFKYAAP